jgi:EAL domain-containing protein (putative c-di-GMP-specific phosphodiesterase class I)
VCGFPSTWPCLSIDYRRNAVLLPDNDKDAMAAAHEILMLNFLVEDKSPKTVSVDQILPRALRALRTYLGVDATFVTELGASSFALRYVDAATDDLMTHVEEYATHGVTLVQAVVAGSMPELVRDTARFTDPACVAVAQRLGIRMHLCVPIRLFDGTIFGTLGCLSTVPDVTLTERDLSLVRVFAEMASEHIEADLQIQRARNDAFTRVQSVLASGAVSLAYQPIYDLKLARVIGFESLARITGEPARSPDIWFAEAASVGLEIDLETRVIEEALAGFASLPPGVFIGFNVSPNIVLNGELGQAFQFVPADRILLEINEHLSIREYDEMARALQPLRERGVRISVDDTGDGLSSFQHILSLKPDVIKLHRTLTRALEVDAGRRALATAAIQFAREHESDVIAEGIESASQLKALLALGVTKAQGYFLGRPAPLATAAALCRRQPVPAERALEAL